MTAALWVALAQEHMRGRAGGGGTFSLTLMVLACQCTAPNDPQNQASISSPRRAEEQTHRLGPGLEDGARVKTWFCCGSTIPTALKCPRQTSQSVLILGFHNPQIMKNIYVFHFVIKAFGHNPPNPPASVCQVLGATIPS